MTDHLLEARADLHRSTGIYALTSAVGHILDHLTAQSGSVTDAITDATDPLDEDNHDDRLDRDGDRWTRREALWCHEACNCGDGAWRLGGLNERYGPLTFAPQPADTPAPAHTERHTPPETWEVRLAWLGDEAIGSDADSGFDIWLDNIRAEAWDRGFRAGRKDKA